MQNYAAILTGATGGIGQELAKKLAHKATALLLVGRNQQQLERLVETLKAPCISTPIYCFCADITESNDRDNLLQFIEKLPIKFNVLINNAGINCFSLFEDKTDEMITKLFQVNTIAPLLLTKLLLPHLSQNHSKAQVINIGSTFGNIAYPGFSTYSATKFALRGATEALDREYANDLLRFRYFAPRATRTKLNSDKVNQMNAELKVTMDSPEYVAEQFIKFLESSKQSCYLGWPEKMFVVINQLFPSLVSKSLNKILPSIKKYAKP